MPDFSYTARGPSGQKHEGVVSAQDHAAAVSELGDRGLVPLQVRERTRRRGRGRGWHVGFGALLPSVGRFASQRRSSLAGSSCWPTSLPTPSWPRRPMTSPSVSPKARRWLSRSLGTIKFFLMCSVRWSGQGSRATFGRCAGAHCRQPRARRTHAFPSDWCFGLPHDPSGGGLGRGRGCVDGVGSQV